MKDDQIIGNLEDAIVANDETLVIPSVLNHADLVESLKERQSNRERSHTIWDSLGPDAQLKLENMIVGCLNQMASNVRFWLPQAIQGFEVGQRGIMFELWTSILISQGIDTYELTKGTT